MIYRSPFNIKNPEKTTEQLSNEKGVIVFGTGNFGKIVLYALEKKNIKILYVCDNNSSK